MALIFGMGIAAQSQSYVPEKNNLKIKIKPSVAIEGFAFNLKDVRLLHGSPFKNAMDKDAAYLLLIEPNRLLHRFYKNAGLPTKGEVYGGWESLHTQSLFMPLIQDMQQMPAPSGAIVCPDLQCFMLCTP
jgi:hypothetical protein